jgi:hypothetical protein
MSATLGPQQGEFLTQMSGRLVQAALEQLLSLRSVDVHVEPRAVTPQSRIIEASSGPCEGAGQYFRVALRGAHTQGENDGQAGAPNDQRVIVGRRLDARRLLRVIRYGQRASLQMDIGHWAGITETVRRCSR